jgi:hypothetical protein
LPSLRFGGNGNEIRDFNEWHWPPFVSETALEGFGIDSMIRSDINEIEYSLALIVRSEDMKDADEILRVNYHNGEAT